MIILKSGTQIYLGTGRGWSSAHFDVEFEEDELEIAVQSNGSDENVFYKHDYKKPYPIFLGRPVEFIMWEKL